MRMNPAAPNSKPQTPNPKPRTPPLTPLALIFVPFSPLRAQRCLTKAKVELGLSRKPTNRDVFSWLDVGGKVSR